MGRCLKLINNLIMRINPEGREFGNKEMLPIPKELDEELVNKAGEHLGIIKDSLHDFTVRIQEE